jgi:ATP-dependent Lon protease
MTGEMTLSGRVLPVGGIKEKVLAAHRLGVKEVLIPKRNEKAFKEDIPENVRNDLQIHLVSTLDEVLRLALGAAEPRAVTRPGEALQPRMPN